MPDRLEALEKIVILARHVRQLEHELVRLEEGADMQNALEQLKAFRLELDEALLDLEQLEQS